MAVLDCQLFDYENQVGSEYLFGTVRCPALIEQLGKGAEIISDEREGLHQKNPLVSAFSRAVSKMLAPHMTAEQEKLKHLERAATSDRTSHMIEHLLHHMSQAATHDMGIVLPASEGDEVGPDDQTGYPAALGLTTPFYYRKTGHSFHVSLLIDPEQLPAEGVMTFDFAHPDEMRFEPVPADIPVSELANTRRIEWSVVADVQARDQLTVRVGPDWAWCEVVVADNAAGNIGHARRGPSKRIARPKVTRDHGIDMFLGYEFRNLENEPARAIYDPEARKS